MAGSGGVYISREKALMVPLSSLGVKMVGSRVSIEANDDDDNATLIHEITHQMMNHWLRSLPTWFVEGSAEYCEMLEYNRSGRFSLNNLSNIIQNYTVKQNYGIKAPFKMLDLDELMNIQPQAWSAALTKDVDVEIAGRKISNVSQARQNYGSAGLLTFYFYHLDGEGDAARMLAYLRAIEQVKEQGDTLEKEAAVKNHLLYGRSYAQLAEDVKKGLKRVGVEVIFDTPGKNGPVSAIQTE
jgi:lipoate-protein ligase A